MNKAKPTSPFRLASLLRLQKDLKLALQLFKNPNPNPNGTEAPPLKPYRYNLLHYDLTITKLGRAKMFDEMQKIFHQLKHDTRVIPEEIIFCNVISFYGRARLLEHALQVFDEMSSFNVQRTVKFFNTLLNAMLTCGKLDRMKELFQIMEKYVSPYHHIINLERYAIAAAIPCFVATVILCFVDYAACVCSSQQF